MADLDEGKLKELFGAFLKEQGIEPPPPKEPETYAEFFERFTSDFTKFLSTHKETPPEDEGNDNGGRKPDEAPSSVHPMFKRIAGGKQTG